MPNYYYPRTPNMQGSGFYNPYMRGPDWGQGGSMIAQQIMQVMLMKQQQEQQRLENFRADERLRLAQKADKRAERDSLKPEPPTALQSNLAYIAAKFPEAEGDLGKAAQIYRNMDSPTRKQLEMQLEFELKEYNRKLELASQYETASPETQARLRNTQDTLELKKIQAEERVREAQRRRDMTRVNGVIRRLNNEIKALEKVAGDPVFTFSKDKDRIESEIANITEVLSYLEGAATHLNDVGPLTDDLRFALGVVASNIKDVKSGKILDVIYNQLQGKASAGASATPTKKEQEMVEYNGKKYPLNPDGTVTIDGKKYRIQ